MQNNIPKSYRVTQKGFRESGNNHPHSIKFSTMMSFLKMHLGLEQNIYINNGEIQDNDYKFHLGVSGEAFGLEYNIQDILKSNRWGIQPLKDCFSVEGIKIRLIADKRIHEKDIMLNPDTIQEEIVKHLLKNLPVLFLTQASTEMILGFDSYGETIYQYHGYGETKSGKFIEGNSVPFEAKRLNAIILIDGVGQQSDKRDIIIRALKRGHDMLTETGKLTGSYCYCSQLYEKWISRLDNDENYKSIEDKYKYINPEKFNLAERRIYCSTFFRQAETLLGENCLQEASYCFIDIHNKMWDIHHMVTGENKGKLLERETRNKIIEILKQCQQLDLKAAESIKTLLDNCNMQI